MAVLLLLMAFLAGGCSRDTGDGSNTARSSNVDTPSASRPPNVLLIVADDMGYNDLGINNSNPNTHTPTLDQLAREGVRFTQHYSDTVCSSSRAALLTGYSPARLGYEPNARGVSPQITTLAEALREHGYQTWHIGKWHIGDSVRAAWPDRQGFQHWFGFLDQWLLAGAHEDGKLVAAPPRYTDPWLMTDGDAGRQYPGHLEDILTEKAVSTVHALAASGKPWFMNLWFFAPHGPVTPAPQYAALYPATPAGRYRALIHQLDSNVGRVLKALSDSGQMDSTIVVFVSDNGSVVQERNLPFAGTKTTFGEGGVRTPMMIRWPDGSGKGQIRTDVAAIYDIYPTILGHLGFDAPANMDGKNLFPPPDAASTAPRRLFWEMYTAGHFGYSVLDQSRWRLYKTWPFSPWNMPPVLYDLAGNTALPVNVATAQPKLVADLTTAWQQWHAEVHRPPLSYRRDEHGRGALTGLDFLRTPGFGGFTFALAIKGDYQGMVARQEGVWSAQANADGALSVDVGGHALRGSLPQGGCHSFAVRGQFARRTTDWKNDADRIVMELDIDGKPVDSVQVEGKIVDDNFSAPTMVGLSNDDDANRSLSEPLLLSVGADDEVWTPARVHEQLCSKGQ
jgi:arylsulfatase A-like enzyme